MRNETKSKAISIIDRIALFFFCVLAWFLPMAPAVIEVSFGFLFLCFIIKAFIIKDFRNQVRIFLSDSLNVTLLIFYLCIGLSIFAAGPLWQKSFKPWFSKWGEGVWFFYIARYFLNQKRVKILLSIFLLSAALAGVNGVYQWIHGVGFVRGFAVTVVEGQFSAVRSTFNHYNNFATFIITMFMVSLGFLLAVKNKYIKIVISFLMALLFFNLLLTSSRAGWLGLFFGLTLFALLYPAKYNKKFLIYMFLLIFTVFLSFPKGADTIWGFIVRADAGRFEIWSAAFKMFYESPIIGQGLGLFMKKIQSYGLGALYAHNCYVQILAETGLLGLGSFLVFLSFIFKYALIELKRLPNMIFLGLFCGLSAYLVHSFFDTQLYALRLATLFWVFLGLLAAYYPSINKQKASFTNPKSLKN
jgi:O-antigen ligase